MATISQEKRLGRGGRSAPCDSSVWQRIQRESWLGEAARESHCCWRPKRMYCWAELKEMPTSAPTGSDARPEQKFKQVEGKYRKRRHWSIMEYQPQSSEINKHSCSERNSCFYWWLTLMLLRLQISRNKKKKKDSAKVPPFYTLLLPFSCLQTLISQLVLVKRLSLQIVRLRGKKRGLGSLSITPTFRQINCPPFFSGANHNL